MEGVGAWGRGIDVIVVLRSTVFWAVGGPPMGRVVEGAFGASNIGPAVGA